MKRVYTLSAFTENSPGVLHRITAAFTRRKINIESLTVSESEKKGISRFTIVVKTEPDLIEKVAKTINRVIEVVDVYVSENQHLIYKEISFIRVATETPQQRSEIEEFVHRYGGVVRHASDASLVVETTGTEDEINSLCLLLEPFGILEFIRSGRIAICKHPRSAGEMFVED